jgi:hypothetical protein
MYPSLAAAKAAVIAVAEEIATFGLPSGICPIVFVFTGVGNGNCAVDVFPFIDFSNRKTLIWVLSQPTVRFGLKLVVRTAAAAIYRDKTL